MSTVIEAWIDLRDGEVMLTEPIPFGSEGTVLLGSIETNEDVIVYCDDYGHTRLEVSQASKKIDAGNAVLCAQRRIFGLTWKEAQS